MSDIVCDCMQFVAHHPSVVSEWTLLHGSMEAPQSIKGALRSSHTGSETVIDLFFLNSMIASPGNWCIQFSSLGIQLSRMDDAALMFLITKYLGHVINVIS